MMSYRRDIDGLRAVAVILVILHHLGVPWVGGGFVGVDVFFVISGYLIGSLLLTELKTTGSIDFKHFYRRRARRILPALLTVMLVSMLLAVLLLRPDDLVTFGYSTIANLFFYANLYFWQDARNYFAVQGAVQPLLHGWSLAVEEQYYLFFPLLLLIVMRWRRACVWILCMTAVFSLIFSEWMVHVQPQTAFYLLPSRLWELLLGVLAACRNTPLAMHRLTANALALLSLLALAAVAYHPPSKELFPGVRALVPCVAAAALIHLGSHYRTWVHHLLSTRLMVGVGLISYSLYLWHWPLLVFWRSLGGGVPIWWHMLVYLFICFVLSILSWKVVEQPFRQRHGLMPVLLMGAVLLFGAVSVIHVHGFPGRLSEPMLEIPEQNILFRQKKCLLLAKQGVENLAPECTRREEGTIRVLLWGDSLAAHYYPGLSALLDPKRFSVSQYTKAACSPLWEFESYNVGPCIPFNRTIVEQINQNRFDVVLVSANWISMKNLTPELLVEKFMQTMAQIHSKAAIIVIGPGIAFNQPVYNTVAPSTPFFVLLQRWFYGEVSRVPVTNPNIFIMEQMLSERLKASGLHYISVVSTLCPEQNCPYRDAQGALLTGDKWHLSREGSIAVVSKAILPELFRIVAP